MSGNTGEPPPCAASGLGNPALRKTVSLLGAFCLFLSAIEYMIPKPLPFMRIGIANLPLMLALDIFPFHCFMILAGIKVLGQALITGTLFSYIFLFSMAGTGLSAVVMYALRRVLGQKVSFTGIGTAGAMTSNISQLALAHVFIFQGAVRFITPPFLCAGLVTGIALGLFCEAFARRSQWYAAARGAANGAA
ncbi:MAG: Gx transporter family protein [Spirochaetaceae bacterium]|jgi:heptaprenyl diphosphate synthase|nr:Gx transporter family protein [Spirochaetaceae bacterium]